MTPLEQYYKDVAEAIVKEDPAQVLALTHLEKIYTDLERESSKSRWQKLVKKEKILGLYFWGGVGRGKTYMMDLFFNSLSTEKKLRLHFHRFMQMIHTSLTEIAGQKNPLEKVAKQLSSKYLIICLDEFFVKDITDAMILGNLFEALFKNGIVLVTTSNIPPDELYKDGLQREKFLPAIAALKTNNHILEIASDTDYRMRSLTKAKLYYYPISNENRTELANIFNRLALHQTKTQNFITRDGSILINNRNVEYVVKSSMQICFEFSILCTSPRSQNDYISLASEFSHIFLINMPQLDSSKEDEARRFINLVDEFYDRGVKLFILAQTDIENIYTGNALKFEMDRTKSRLIEMQSIEYLNKKHLC